MIVKELYKTRNDGVNLFRTYSNENLIIRKVGTNEEYAEAIDLEGARFEYIETDKIIVNEADEDNNQNNEDYET